MLETKMEKISKGAGVCRFENGRILPCDYHINRINSTVFKLDDNACDKIDSESNYANITRTDQITSLAQLFYNAKTPDPAGGWYLVKEQREWLENKLVSVLNTDSANRILVSGVASFVHAYTFLEIVINAAEKKKIDLGEIEIDFVDKCIYPLFQIAAMENNIRYGVYLKKKISVFDQRFEMSKSIFQYIKNLQKKLKQLNVRIFLRDLRQLEDLNELGHYDIITEHFLTSMVRKNLNAIGKIRESYSKILKLNGHLLLAAGVDENPKESTSTYLNLFAEIHEKLNLKELSREKVWDPYDKKDDIISKFAIGDIDSYSAPLINYLFDFQKK